MEDFVTFEMAKTLKEKGFKEKCLFAYNDEQVINPKIVEEYGNLTDDGYYELTEDCGGKLKFDNVYIYEQQIILRDKIIIERNFIDAPTISQVMKWLREKEISIEPCATPYSYWYYMIKEKGTIKVTYTGENYKTYELAALAGIKYALDNLI